MRSKDFLRAECTGCRFLGWLSLCLFILTPLLALSSKPSQRLVPRLKGYLNSPYGYWEYLPENYYHVSAPLPLVIYLHGIKEAGNGQSVAELYKVVLNGVPLIIKKYERNFPFILISPQSPGVEEGFFPERLEHLIEIIKSNYKVDESRIYVTGVSYGGYAALKLAAYMPDKIAAVVPFSSCGGDNDLDKLKDVPMWAFVNAGDKKEIPECMHDLIERIHDHGGTPLLTVHQRKGHNAWFWTYKKDYLWDWLLKQHRNAKNENQAPILINPGNKIVGIGSPVCYTIMASDGNNDKLRFRIEGPLAEGSYFRVRKNGTAELLMNTLMPGTFSFSVVVDDGKGGTSRQSFYVKTSYTLLFFPYLLLFIFQPAIIEVPLASVAILLAFWEKLTALFFNFITRFFHWFFITILVAIGFLNSEGKV
jgi:pimeloyl-ACP methyl ester carboxylesterase